MSDILVYLLLFLSLALPAIGAVLLRLSAERLGRRGLFIGAGLIFGIATASALFLARSDVGVLRIGDISLILPSAGQQVDVFVPVDNIPPAESDPADPANPTDPTVQPTGAPVLPTLTPRPSITPSPTEVLPTDTPEPPTATPEPPTPTPEPPTATPEPPSGEQRYTVQSGDTLRSIAEQFNVTVEALLEVNNLTPEDADSLRVGQELIIPS